MVGSDKNGEDAPNEHSVLEEQDSINNVSNVSEFEFVATEEELKGKIVYLEHDLKTTKQGLQNSESIQKLYEDSLNRMKLEKIATAKLTDATIESLETALKAADREKAEIVAKNEEEVRQMKDQLKKAKAEIVQLIDDGERLMDESNERHALEIQQLHEQEKQLEAEIETLEGELRAANENLVDVEEQEEQMKKLKLEYRETVNINSTLNQENDMLNEELKKSKKHEEKLRSRIKSLEVELGASTEEVDAQQEHIRKLELEIKEADNSKSTLSEENDDLKKKLSDSEKFCDSLKTYNGVLHENCDAQEKELKDLKAQEKKLKSWVENLEGQLGAANKEVDAQQEHIRELELEIKQANNLKCLLSQENDELEKKLSNSEKMRHNLEKYNDELFEKLALREKHLEKSKKQEENWKSRIETLEAQVGKALKQIGGADAQQEHIRKLELEIQEANNFKSTLSQDNDELKKKLNNSEKMRYNLEKYNKELFKEFKAQEEKSKLQVETLKRELGAATEKLVLFDAQQKRIRYLELEMKAFNNFKCTMSKENDSLKKELSSLRKVEQELEEHSNRLFEQLVERDREVKSLKEMEAKWKRRVDTLERDLEAEKKKSVEIELLKEEAQKENEQLKMASGWNTDTGYLGGDYIVWERKTNVSDERVALEGELNVEQQQHEPRFPYHHSVFDEVSNGEEQPSSSGSQQQ